MIRRRPFLSAFLLLLVGLALITGRSGVSTDYIVHYRNVTGLRYGAPVFYEGYRIGEVSEVEPQRGASGTRYQVTLSVRRDWTIPDDSVASLQSSGLLADMSVGIKEGSSRTMLAPGAEIKGAETADVENPNMMRQLFFGNMFGGRRGRGNDR